MTASAKRLHLWKANLVSSLRQLAAPPHEQAAYLQSLDQTDGADELALEFDDAVRLVEELVAERLLTRKQADAILRVDEQLERMSGAENKELWGLEALRRAPQWQEVRRRAAAALATLPEQRGHTRRGGKGYR